MTTELTQSVALSPAVLPPTAGTGVVPQPSAPPAGRTGSRLRTIPRWVVRWLDSTAPLPAVPADQLDRVDWVRCLPFLSAHVACLAVLWVGWSWPAVATALGLYLVRMFAITGFFHRYFSHRTFRTHRGLQFAFALLGGMSGQRSALWWAAHHRHHHRVSDQPGDPHSPRLQGVLWSHMLWFMSRRHYPTDFEAVRDLARYPELRFLARFDSLPPLLLLALCYGAGSALQRWAPGWGTDGWQMLVWGGFISTVVLFHGTVTINSLAHLWGSRRFATRDDSRNNFWLALITLGEGWHNNHHYYPGAARQGFYWWEIDITYYVLKLMAGLGLIWDLNRVPDRVYASARTGRGVPAKEASG